jgi:small subunit ribosomal protein S16
MQRTGRKGHAQFRVVVQDARRTPTSGRVVAFLGNFDPHTKTAVLDKEKASFYLEHGAQPSERAARLLKAEGVKLPKWVVLSDSKKKRAIRNPEKLRKNQPKEAKPKDVKPADAEAATETEPAEAKRDSVEQVEESPADAETPAEELKTDVSAAEADDEKTGKDEAKAEKSDAQEDSKKQK